MFDDREVIAEMFSTKCVGWKKMKKREEQFSESVGGRGGSV